MRESLRIMFDSISSLFRAIDFSARTIENYAKWSEAESAAFEAEAKIERQARIEELHSKLSSDSVPELAS